MENLLFLGVPILKHIRVPNIKEYSSSTFPIHFVVALQFNSHKSVQKLFHNLHIIFSNSLMGFKVICQLEKEPLKGLANVQEIFS